MRHSILAPAAAAVAAVLLVQAPAFAQGAGSVKFAATEQPGEMSHSSLVGLKIKNAAGQIIGDINYLVLDPKGQVTTVVLGVGGMLGVGEKNVGVPFSALTITTDGNRNLQARLDATKEVLMAAPAYTWTEKSTMEKVKEKAKDLSEKAQEKAKDLSERATEAAKDLSEKAKEKASDVKEKMSAPK